MSVQYISPVVFAQKLQALYNIIPVHSELPGNEISREAAASLTASFIDQSGIILQYKKEIDREYIDIDDILREYRYGVDVCAMIGLFDTKENNSFKPRDPLTECEAENIIEKLKNLISQAQNVQGILTCWDMINNPQSVYSNMTSLVEKSYSFPVMHFTPYESHTAPWYIGTDHAFDLIPDGAMEYCKICIRTENLADPYLTLSSPVFEETVYPCAVGEEDGFVTLLFNIGDAFRALRHANLTAENPYANSPHYPLRKMHLKMFNSRYLRIALYPFGECENPSADILYFAFCSDKEAAETYTAAGNSNPYVSGKDLCSHPLYAPVNEKLITEYDEKIKQRIKEIRETPNVLTPDQIKGKCYYISSINGDDSNDGLSPETAWKSITKLISLKEGEGFSTPLAAFPAMDHIPQRGDGVFLERGSVFNAELTTGHAGDYVMWLVDGVSYGAYGEGEKPVITCCVDYNGSRNWVKTEYENVWMLDQTIDIPSCAVTTGYSDIANIIVTTKEGKTGYGIKVLAATPENPFNGAPTVCFGNVTNGFEIYKSGGVEFTSPGCLRNNLEFFHDWSSARVYMYCDKGNPGEYYESVILSRQGIGAYGGSDCTVDNLAFKYLGTFGISTVNIKNLTVQNCTFEWTGGAIQYGTTIFGGGIQNWCNCDGFHIYNCYSDQSLDAAFSTQGVLDDEDVIMHDVRIEKCVAINANSSVEIWIYSKKLRLISNVIIRDNLFGYVGYHFGNRKVLWAKDACILQLGIYSGQKPQNVVLERNLCMYASSCCYWARPFLCRGDSFGTIIRDNTYIMSNRKMYMLTSPDLRNDSANTSCAHIPFSKEEAERLLALGIDRESKFYYIDGFAFEGEDRGVYVPPYFPNK